MQVVQGRGYLMEVQRGGGNYRMQNFSPSSKAILIVTLAVYHFLPQSQPGISEAAHYDTLLKFQIQSTLRVRPKKPTKLQNRSKSQTKHKRTGKFLPGPLGWSAEHLKHRIKSPPLWKLQQEENFLQDWFGGSLRIFLSHSHIFKPKMTQILFYNPFY